MYSNEDLNHAVKEGIFEQESVDKFRLLMAQEKNTKGVDEENFKLLSGFNDIFVVIASLLLLISAGWIASGVNDRFSAFVTAMLAWGLSEFFVRHRKMSLPAIVLLVVVFLEYFLIMNLMLVQIMKSHLSSPPLSQQLRHLCIGNVLLYQLQLLWGWGH